MLSLRAEARAAVELWLVPALLAALPYRVGVALARFAAHTLPLYAASARAAAASWRTVAGQTAEREWLAAYRFAQLIDHTDLFWALLRSRAFLLRRLAAPPPPVMPGRPVLVLSFHFGQGMWLLAWLAAHGIAARFVSVRLARAEAESALHYAYARLRIRMVERLTGVPPIFTGGARREIAQALVGRGAVYGLVDVPVPDAAAQPANAMLHGQRVLLPEGLLESARGCGAQALVLSAHALPDGSRMVRAEAIGDADAVTIATIAAHLERRIDEAPSAWHFWHLWPRFLAA